MAAFASRLDLLISGTTAQSSIADVSATVRWMSRATARRSRPASAGQLITVDPSIQAMTTRLLRKPNALIAQAFTSRLVAVAQNAYRRWPVLTGYSRSLLSVEWEARSDTHLTFTLEAGADYSTAIHGGEVVENLLRRPVLEAARQIAADVAKGLGS